MLSSRPNNATFSPQDHDWENECVTHKKDGILYSKWMLSNVLDDLRTYQVRDDDVWFVSYPKSGSTWIQQMLRLISVKGDRKQITEHVLSSIKYIEMNAALHYSHFEKFTTPFRHHQLQDAPSPRIIKTHLPDKHLPQQLFENRAKVIYISRNPKDVAVSYFHFHNYNVVLPRYTQWNQFYQDFVRNEVIYGSWFDHNLFWWKRRHLPNILFFKYEDVKMDPRSTVIQMADFLGHNLSDEAIDEVVKHSSFSSMKDDAQSNIIGTWLPLFDHKIYSKTSFIRKGEVGDWKNYFTVTQNEEYDRVYHERMQGTGLKLCFELIN
ncbi:sulfotransferase 1B1-like [Antedon mediterranea]|uniref:sulfotransferase 1B1-like n=1 Tax=Antedon mediterranea TaxID=105859 RepID=UPI003AF99BF1